MSYSKLSLQRHRKSLASGASNLGTYSYRNQRSYFSKWFYESNQEMEIYVKLIYIMLVSYLTYAFFYNRNQKCI